MTEPQQDSPESEKTEQLPSVQDQSNSSSDNNQSTKPRNRKNKPRGRKNNAERASGKKSNSSSTYNRDSKGFKLTPDGLVRHFLGCRVCCYFLTGTQVIYGRDVVDRLVDEFDGKWLSVPLGYEMRKLMQQTYGMRLDQNEELIDFSCEVCCRRFVVELPEAQPVESVAPSDAQEKQNEPDQERIEVEPEAIPTKRSIEENMQEWDEDNLPMMRVEFKHRR